MDDDQETLFEPEPPPDDRQPWQRSNVVPIDASRGYVGRFHPDTAHAMEARALPQSGTWRREVYGLLMVAPMTDDEMERATGRSHQSVSGARAMLKRDGWVRDTGARRLTRYGNVAIVWEAVPE